MTIHIHEHVWVSVSRKIVSWLLNLSIMMGWFELYFTATTHTLCKGSVTRWQHDISIVPVARFSVW